jgi:DNA polymerase III gamma/tau subunit
VLTVSSKTVTIENIVAQLGTPDRAILVDLLKAICIKDEKEIARAVNALQQKNSTALKSYDELLELIRRGLLIRIGEEKSEDEELAKLSKEYATVIGSKLILLLLEKRHLIEVSEAHSWNAFFAIIISTIE